MKFIDNNLKDNYSYNINTVYKMNDNINIKNDITSFANIKINSNHLNIHIILSGVYILHLLTNCDNKDILYINDIPVDSFNISGNIITMYETLILNSGDIIKFQNNNVDNQTTFNLFPIL